MYSNDLNTCRLRMTVVVILIATLAASFAHAKDDGLTEISILAGEGKYKSVIRRLSSHVWNNRSNPRLMIEYCEAQFSTKNADTACRIQKTSPRQAHFFAEALWNTWSGNTRSGRTKFELLLNDVQWASWGKVGLFEWAYHTENFVELAFFLNEFKPGLDDSSGNWFGDIHKLYRVLLAHESADWDGVEKLLREFTDEQIANTPILFTAQSRLYFIRGQTDNFSVLLLKARQILGQTTTFKQREAEYALLRGDVRSSINALKKSASLSPDDTHLTLQTAYLSILSDSDESMRAAMNHVLHIAQTKKNDVSLLLGVAITLKLFRKPEESDLVFGMIERHPDDLAHFASFHVLAGWDAVYRGDLDSAREVLERTFTRAPMHVEGNRLFALIAKRQDNPKDAAHALKNLLKADPYNENFANLVLHFRARHQLDEFDVLYREIVRRKNRYSSSFQEKLNTEMKGGNK